MHPAHGGEHINSAQYGQNHQLPGVAFRQAKQLMQAKAHLSCQKADGAYRACH